MLETDLLFNEEAEEDSSPQQPWTLLIVDDEPEVHAVTRLALSDFQFEQRPLHCLGAHSGAEARLILKEHPEIAVVLLDVVMETEHAGLDVVRFIRNELGNKRLRIILRTGNPGQAPALKVITEYDINDYKQKSELTADKLISALYTALRSYGDLCELHRHRRGLETIIAASAELFSQRDTASLAHSVLSHLTRLIFDDHEPSMATIQTLAVSTRNEKHEILASTTDARTTNNDHRIDAPTDARLRTALEQRRPIYGEDFFIGYLADQEGTETLYYLGSEKSLPRPDAILITIFMRNVAAAGENIRLNNELDRSQRELVYVLSEAIEKRSLETGNHVRRVAAYTRLLGEAAGLTPEEVDLLTQAAPLHDTGKIAIPDHILNKPGIHTDEERQVMRTHASMGYDILKDYDRPLLQAAAIIAEQHHEHWDGQGYPKGLCGENIHIYGRIGAVADVFDALLSSRCYKQPWPIERVIQFLREQAGRQFDPRLVEIFLDHLPEINAIRARFPDTENGSHAVAVEPPSANSVK